MSINRSSYKVRQILRAVAAPSLTLGVLLAIEQLSFLATWMPTFEVPRRAAIALAGLWVVVATGIVGYRTRRDARAHQRLQQLRDAAQAPGRALVHLQTEVGSSGAGQQVVVVNIATGHCYRLWFPEAHLPVGSHVVIEQREVGVAVVDWLITNRVVAGHRHEARHTQPSASTAQPVELAHSRNADEEAAALIRETEDFLESL